MQIDPCYFELDKCVPTLENHFTNILEELLNHDDQWCALVHNQGQPIPVSSSEFNMEL